MEPIDSFFGERAARLTPSTDPAGVLAPFEVAQLERLFTAQAIARHTDLLTRDLQKQGEAFYSIGSSGHEANAAVAMALSHTDPALLHYRSAGFYAARAAQVPGTNPAREILSGAMSSTDDVISGGRHKVFGNKQLNVIPQTSTISSHLPRAFGLAYALDNLKHPRGGSPWPADAVVACSFGDASLNHSTAQGAINAAAYCAHRGLPTPLLFICEDNGIGISTRTPSGWVESRLRATPGIEYVPADGADPLALIRAARNAVDTVRRTRRPVMLHLQTVRFMGHAGSDAEIAYRTASEIEADYERDPLLATAQALVTARALTAEEIVARYEKIRAEVVASADSVPRTYLSTADEVTAPIVASADEAAAAGTDAAAGVSADIDHREEVFGATLPEYRGDLTLAQTINSTLKDMLAAHPESFILGEDVARKGGVYGVTRGILKTFGRARAIDTILDEQTVLGIALGGAVAGHLPVPEIQYLAYLHNAEDQLRGEAATLRFFSDGQYENGMVVRIAGLAYQRGFGGHFHNDNSLAVLRDIPGIALAVPSHPSSAPALYREAFALAKTTGRVCVIVEPIALYHQRDLEPGDGAWQAPYAAPSEWAADRSGAIGSVRRVREGADLVMVTFGNGVHMSQRAAAQLAEVGIEAEIIDLQWLTPLPVEAMLERLRGDRPVLVVDETRRSGGVSESIITALVEGGVTSPVQRVTSTDSFIPLGPAANHVLLSVDEIVKASRDLVE